MIDAGVSVQRIRKSIGALRQVLPNVQRPLAELVLVATGDVVLAIQDGSAFEVGSGQEWIFEVAHFQREVEDWRSSVEALPARPKPRSIRRSRGRRRTA